MSPKFADRLMERPLAYRWVKGHTTLGKRFAGVLVSHNGKTAKIKLDKNEKIIEYPLENIGYR